MKICTKLFVICLMGYLPIIAFSQSQTALQGNLGVFYQNESGSNSDQGVFINGPGMALDWADEGGTRHLLGIDNIRYQYERPGMNMEAITSDFQTRLRYGMRFILNKGNETATAHPFIGVESGLMISHQSVRPGIATAFPQQEFLMDFSMSVEPGVRIDFGKMTFWDISIPFQLAHASFQNDRTRNPSIPAQNQSVNTINFEMGGVVRTGIRVGLGVYLCANGN